ncbi:WGR domain-containing protein [Herbaspirillum robiniae]|uniref:WGR domain-containing protein n=1 Tax=Herbaspirillum robiniae TaxID=2014887 RepID=A0A246WNV7_9BURK|nr:WGR domain-containing protein [Herbaspirillum robiniae]NUU03555.1 WGR domain-containing protein [Herbaspirillum robiniae]OWY28053.1 hypothetical protein CEJ42_15620 [Herbaspirillum robiniae]
MIDSADNATHSLPVTGATRLHFSDQARTTFTVDLGQDLLGDWILTQTWGGSRQRGGGKRLVVDGHEAGLQMLQKIAEKKERSGYDQVHPYHVRSHWL